MTAILSRLGPAVLAFALALAAPVAAQPAHRVEILHQGLDRPWALAFLPGGDDLAITGRGGDLWLWRAGRLEAVSGLPRVTDAGQGGLLDIAPDPDFARNRRVWLAWAGAGQGGASTHLGHARLDEGAGRLADLETVFVAQPFMNSPAHFGARIVFAEGHLFLGLGDRAQKDFGPHHVSQRLDTENGSVIRLALDGTVPADNPFAGGPAPAIWSHGHRNIQAMALHPETGAIWLAEHGENGGDEINLLRRGGNYGWPLAAHGVTYQGGEVFAPPHRAGDGFVAPAWHSPAGRGAPYPPSGMAFYAGDAFPDWRGLMLLGNLGQQHLGLFAVTGEAVEPAGRLLEDQGWRIRDVAVGPDGFVYVISDGEDGVLARIVPE